MNKVLSIQSIFLFKVTSSHSKVINQSGFVLIGRAMNRTSQDGSCHNIKQLSTRSGKHYSIRCVNINVVVSIELFPTRICSHSVISPVVKESCSIFHSDYFRIVIIFFPTQALYWTKRHSFMLPGEYTKFCINFYRLASAPYGGNKRIYLWCRNA